MYYYNNELPPQQGWVCPKCGRVNAPWMPTCGCVSSQTSGTPYLVKTSSISQDSHEIAKDEPQTEKGGCTNCDGKDLCNNAFTEISQYCGAYEPQNGYQTFNGTSVYVSRLEDEPQTDCPWK